jgi:preprotein translocase subunit SecD
MDFYTDRKFQFLAAMLILFAVGLFVYPVYAGLLLIGALIFFGAFSLMWKESHIKIAGMVFLVLLALLNVSINPMKFGIDFVGGTRIPVVLAHDVDQATMDSMVQTIKTRASVLGLTETQVLAIGTSEIDVEIPSTDQASINDIEATLSHQGVYQGVVDGSVAVDGGNIYPSSIAELQSPELLQEHADWGVSFSVDQAGAEQFAQAAKGKADYPIYMYLDRPQDVALFYEQGELQASIPPDSDQREALESLQDALALNGSSIPVYVMEDLPANLTPMDNNTRAFISANDSAATKAKLKALGFTVVQLNESEMTPDFIRTDSGVLVVNELDAAGLLTAPLLSAGITSGLPNYNYEVTGSVNDSNPNAKAADAAERAQSIESILKGGALPVQISLGSMTTLPASLGSQFLKYSVIAIVFSLVAISVLIGLRYRNVMATLPIILISLAELTILLSILGSFTIDLPAMAGIIAAIGVGVDAQIVITDELLKTDEHSTREKTSLAFDIIRTNAIVAIFAMVPLLFSGLVEVIGFAISTILGALLGYMLTRPAYAAIVERVLAAEKSAESKGSTQTVKPQ